MRTITQAAEELNVSRTKIYKEIEKLNIETQKLGKHNFIDDGSYEKIKTNVLNEQNASSGTHEPNHTNESSSTKERLEDLLDRDRNVLYNKVTDREYTDLKERISFLEDQVKQKDLQIKEKDVQINNKDFQLNGLIQSNFNLSKSLNPPEDIVTEEASVTVVSEKKSWISRIFGKKH